MQEQKRYLIGMLLLLFVGGNLTAQISKEDSVALKKILEGDKPLILNQEVIKSIQFEKIRPDQHREMLFDPRFPTTYDPSLPIVEKKDTAFLTLKPYLGTMSKFVTAKDTLKIYETLNLGPGPGAPTSISGIGIVLVFDAETLLRRIFWKSERARRRNAKRAYVLKYY